MLDQRHLDRWLGMIVTVRPATLIVVAENDAYYCSTNGT